MYTHTRKKYVYQVPDEQKGNPFGQQLGLGFFLFGPVSGPNGRTDRRVGANGLMSLASARLASEETGPTASSDRLTGRLDKGRLGDENPPRQT